VDNIALHILLGADDRAHWHRNVLILEITFYRSDGVIHDFAGPYTISVGNFSFGKPLKFVKLDTSHISAKQWDEAVLAADNKFAKTMHNICWYQKRLL
jgi:hypothetical protein